MERASKKRKTKILLIKCGWNNCNVHFESDWDLNGHIKSHLEQYKTDEACSCPWHDCEFETDCFKEFQRHVYYHGYYDGLVVQGKNECTSNPNVPKCNINADWRNIVPELKFDFLCEWSECERTFASIIEFQDHIVRHATFEYEIAKTPEDVTPKIQCNWRFCKNKPDNKYRLIEHIKTHSNRKQAACPKCGELFRTRTTLFDHLWRQPDNNTHIYQCARCFKFFATAKLLRSHIAKHVNLHKCSMCDMTCSSASSLATHIRYRHLKDKPFTCMHCDYRCVRESDLEKHVHFVHSKGVYRCDESGCNYAVRTYNLLRRHYLEVHGNNPFIYICHCCDGSFKTGRSLSSHLIKKHDFQLPSGHKRFTYRVDENGFYRLEARRIESLEVTKQILSPNPLEFSEATQDTSCYEIVSMTSKSDERIIVTNDTLEPRLVGEVVISLPSVDNN